MAETKTSGDYKNPILKAKFEAYKAKEASEKRTRQVFAILGAIAVGLAFMFGAVTDPAWGANMLLFGISIAAIIGFLCAIPTIIAYIGMYPWHLILALIAAGTIWYLL